MIKKLDESVINKIAAGEVVERPASVIKELVENSIDARAKRIIIEVKDGGKKLIRISDDGSGIKNDEVLTAILPHTTSKISDIDDLFNIKTLGFRGEALATINAVSNMEITSKTKSDTMGTYFISNGLDNGKISRVGAPDGTTILVQNLFYNTPVRKKFLKTNGVELSYITELVNRLALANPDISFKFVNNNEVKLFTKGDGNLHNVIYEVYKKEIGDKLIAVDYEETDISVKGFLARPEVNRGNKIYENYFINGRYIKSKIIEKAVENGFIGRLMKHRFPFCVLHIILAGNRVDVNVHPNKLEVRFDDENFIYDAVYKAVKDALDEKEYIIKIEDKKKEEKNLDNARDFFYEDKEEKKLDVNEEKVPLNEYSSKNKLRESALIEEVQPSKKLDFTEGDESKVEKSSENERNITNDISSNNTTKEQSSDKLSKVEVIDVLNLDIGYKAGGNTTLQKKIEDKKIDFDPKHEIKEIRGEQKTFLTEEAIKKHRVVGQVFDTYWIIEMENKMYMLDQHAAHEKVLYEALVKKYNSGEINSQALLFPLPLNLNGESIEYLEKHLDEFRKIGFEIEEFGENEYILRAVPYILNDTLDESVLLSLVDEMLEYNKASSFNIYLDTLATVACKAAIKAGDKISFKECEALLRDLLVLDNAYNCPHGRPTIIVFDRKKLEKDFKRIV